MVRDQVFGDGANPIGEIVRINNQPFRVMGVLERKGQSAMGQDQDDTVIAPYTAVQKRLLGTTHLSSILVAAQPGGSTAQLSAGVSELLRSRHQIGAGDTEDFSVRSPEEMARVLSSTTDTMAYLLASVAAISLRRRRHRHHEHHAGVGDGADQGDWPAARTGRQAHRRATAVRGGSAVAQPGRRRAGHRARRRLGVCAERDL